MKHAAKRVIKHHSVKIAAVLVFLAATAIFALIVLLPLADLPADEPQEVVGVQGKERRFLLLIRDREDTLAGAVVVKTDTAAIRVQVTGYPKQTEVIRETMVETLTSCYAEKGVGVSEYLTAVTEDTYDAVLRLSADAIGDLVARLGVGIPYDLREAVGNIPAGEQTLTARQIGEVLCHEGWSWSAVGQAQVQAELTAAIVDRCLSPRQEVITLFNALAALCDDRLTVARFTVLRDELELLAASNTEGLCEVNVPAGRFVGVEGARRYVLTE